jgi:phospholipid/cholesterol/gamma-HCH transport system ATP-binding protein
VGENVAFSLREARVPEAEIEPRVKESLRFVELEHAAGKLPAELSGGMRRRVSIARALVSRPPLVFYDSPTAGLDPVTSQRIISLILRGRDLQGVSALMATHRLQDAFGLAHYVFDAASGRVAPCGGNGAGGRRPLTKVLVIREGRAYFEGDPEEFRESNDPYLQGFLTSAE